MNDDSLTTVKDESSDNDEEVEIETSANSAGATSSASNGRKRERSSKACVQCSLIKRRCDGGTPCLRCVERGISHLCAYLPRRRRGSKHPRSALEYSFAEQRAADVQALPPTASRNMVAGVFPHPSHLSLHMHSHQHLHTHGHHVPPVYPVFHDHHVFHPHAVAGVPVVPVVPVGAGGPGVAGLSHPAPSGIPVRQPTVSGASSSSSSTTPPFPLLSTHAPASFSQETFDALFAQLSAEIFGSPIDVASLIDQPTTEEENVLNQQRETLPPSVQDLLADSHTPFRTSLIFKFAERNASKLTDTMVGLLRDVRNCVFDNEMQVRKINTDVEELCAMEPSLRPRLQRMMTVLDGLQFPAFVTTNRGLLYRFNDAFAAVSRYSREELEQPNFFALELFENECVSSLMEAYVRAIQDTKLETVTHRPILKRKDNRRVETVGAMSMVRDSSGAIIATMTICIPLDGASVGPSS